MVRGIIDAGISKQEIPTMPQVGNTPLFSLNQALAGNDK
jgi:hypothetical protein